MRSIALILVATVALAGGIAAQDPGASPPPPVRPRQVNDSVVALGREIFHGVGGCSACHGDAGVGTDSGPAIAQGVWMHGPDSYEGILARVVHGIPKDLSSRNTAMPMRGWQTLTDDQVHDVAAYVWTISHAWKPRSTPRP